MKQAYYPFRTYIPTGGRLQNQNWLFQVELQMSKGASFVV